jgi:glutathione peroxidase-family protein
LIDCLEWNCKKEISSANTQVNYGVGFSFFLKAEISGKQWDSVFGLILHHCQNKKRASGIDTKAFFGKKKKRPKVFT